MLGKKEVVTLSCRWIEVKNTCQTYFDPFDFIMSELADQIVTD